MTAVVLQLWLGLLEIQGSATCPGPAEVGEQLAKLVPQSEAGEASSRVYLSAGEGFVNIELLGSDGVLSAERRLDLTGSCAEMAEAAAVVVAAWQAKFNPTLAPVAPVAVGGAPPKGATVPPSAVAPQRRATFDAGVAGLTSIVAGKATFGAKAEGVLSPLANPLGFLGFHLGLAASSSHTQTSSQRSIEAEWQRAELLAGLNLRWHGDVFALDLHGSYVVALLHVSGVGGLSEDSSGTSVQFGIATGMRGLWTRRSGAVWNQGRSP